MIEKPRNLGGRYPRGEETKQRVLDAAIEIFGRQGYAGTSIRDIATAAAVNTPALSYYFGSKLGLYEACIEQLSGMVSDRILPAIEACHASLDADADLAGLVESLGEVQNCLIDSFFRGDEGQAIRQLMAWEEAENDEKRSEKLMKQRIGLPVFTTYRRVVERILPSPIPRVELDMHALSLMGLSMIFHFNQCRAIDILDWVIDEDLIGALKSVAYRQLALSLTGLSQPA